MSHPRKHQVVIDVSFNRPINPHRAMYLIELAMGSLEGKGFGRDITRIGMPEARIIRTKVKRLDKVVASRKVKRPRSWQDIVNAATTKKGGVLTLDELLLLAKGYKMTPEEIEAQRQSWARQDMD